MAFLSVSRGRRRGGRFSQGLIGFALWGMFSWFVPDVSAQAPGITEYEIKAVFLFHFAEFVDWPPTAFEHSGAPLVIGVLGDDPFGTYLDETVRDEKVGNRTLEIRRYRKTDEIDNCQILFISQSERGRLPEILDAVKNRSVLTVSDLDNFARRGGMIRFISSNGKVRLSVNVEAATAANLTISSKLLRSVEIIRTAKG